jgi:thioredoxin 1
MNEDKLIEEEKKEKKIVVIDFMAIWCGPCRTQDPILEELKKKFEDKVEFKKIDIDKNGEFADKYVIRAVPTLVIEKDGKVFKKYVGVTSLKELEKTIGDALQ